MVLIWVARAARRQKASNLGAERPLFDHVTWAKLSINTEIHYCRLYEVQMTAVLTTAAGEKEKKVALTPDIPMDQHKVYKYSHQKNANIVLLYTHRISCLFRLLSFYTEDLQPNCR